MKIVGDDSISRGYLQLNAFKARSRLPHFQVMFNLDVGSVLNCLAFVNQ